MSSKTESYNAKQEIRPGVTGEDVGSKAEASAPELRLDKHGLPLSPQPSGRKDDPLVNDSLLVRRLGILILVRIGIRPSNWQSASKFPSWHFSGPWDPPHPIQLLSRSAVRSASLPSRHRTSWWCTSCSRVLGRSLLCLLPVPLAADPFS